MTDSINQPKKTEIDHLIRDYGKTPSHESKSRFLENLSKARSQKENTKEATSISREKTKGRSH